MTDFAPLPSSLKLDFCGMRFESPLVLLSGCVGFGEEYTRVAGFSNRDAGAVCLKGTTLKPRLGNPAHRVYETPSGMLNAIGLQNVGIDAFIAHKVPYYRGLATPVIANFFGNTLEEYGEVAAKLNDAGRAKAGPEWRGFVKDFADASSAALSAANAKDGAALSTAANALSDTCSACHAKFKPRVAD